MTTAHPSGRGRFVVRAEPYLLLLPALLILFFFFLWPALYNFILSLQSISLFELAKGGKWVGVRNYVEMVQDPLTRLTLTNTIFWLTLMTVGLRLVLGLGFAQLLNNAALTRWRLMWLARALVLIPWVTPPVVAVAAWKWMLHPRFGAVNQILLQLGLIDEGIPFLVKTSTVWWAIVAIVVWRELPFVIISLLAGLQSIPQDLYDAARVDGASELRVYRHVTLPLLRPVLVVITLLTTIWTYNNFVYVWLTTQGGPGNFTHVLATQMYTEAFTNYRLGYGAAVGVLMSVTMLLFSIVYFVTVFKRSVGQS
ncbi:MAG: sugar ABC transporter permease [Caldilineaceae bacterium]|nr:sugar ABC transporter permease [Caldilineaceae bacterium]